MVVKKKKAVKQQKKKGKNDNVQIEQERNANGKVTNNIRSGNGGTKITLLGMDRTLLALCKPSMDTSMMKSTKTTQSSHCVTYTRRHQTYNTINGRFHLFRSNRNYLE